MTADVATNLEQIADRILGRIDTRAKGSGNGPLELAWLVEQLRLVWNARGLADRGRVGEIIGGNSAFATPESVTNR